LTSAFQNNIACQTISLTFSVLGFSPRNCIGYWEVFESLPDLCQFHKTPSSEAKKQLHLSNPVFLFVHKCTNFQEKKITVGIQ